MSIIIDFMKKHKKNEKIVKIVKKRYLGMRTEVNGSERKLNGSERK